MLFRSICECSNTFTGGSKGVTHLGEVRLEVDLRLLTGTFPPPTVSMGRAAPEDEAALVQAAPEDEAALGASSGGPRTSCQGRISQADTHTHTHTHTHTWGNVILRYTSFFVAPSGRPLPRLASCVRSHGAGHVSPGVTNLVAMMECGHCASRKNAGQVHLKEIGRAHV